MDHALVKIVVIDDWIIRNRNGYAANTTIMSMQDFQMTINLCLHKLDPAGDIPSWLYNMMINESTIKIMRKVRKLVQ